MTATLAQSMQGAWAARAAAALVILRAATEAPALFKPDAVDEARGDYAHAMQEIARWSA